MFLHFNELSLAPNTNNQQIIALLQLAKTSKEKQITNGFIRFAQELKTYQINGQYIFDSFLNAKTVSPIFKNLFLGVRRYPFYDDENEPQVAEYVQKQFNYQQQRCDGLAIAYLYQSLAVSITQEEWQNRPVVHIEENTLSCEVLHIATAEDLDSSPIQEWHKNSYLQQSPTKELLLTLYPNYSFEPQAIDDLLFWYTEKKDLYERVHLLIRDIQPNPHVGGLGKTEVLKNKSGCSKRLSDEHRICYQIDGIKKHITVLSCKGHYE